MAVDTMVAFALRTPRVFAVARGKLRVEHFDPIAEAHLQLVWRAALNVAGRHAGALPCTSPDLHLLLRTEVLQLAAAEADVIGPEAIEQAVGPGSFLEWCFQTVAAADPAATEREASAFDYLNRFAVERGPSRALQATLADGDGSVPEHLPELLEGALDEVRRATVLAEDPVESAAPEGWTPQLAQRRTTGIAFLDNAMDGGHADGEAYGLLGPTGLGKTTLAVNICVEGAAQDRRQAGAERRAPRHWYFVTYETSAGPVRLKMWGYAAQLHWDSLKNFRREDLSTDANRKPYELLRFRKEMLAGRDPGPELARLERALAELAVNVHLVDMSGSGKDRCRGTGLVEEIRDILLRERDGKGHAVGGVIIDYAGLAVTRHISAQGLKVEQVTRHLLKSFPYDCRRLIAEYFQCPVWVLHQSNTEANRRAPSSVPHHSFASEAGLFAENLDFCFCLGTKDHRTSTCLLSCSKTRWAGSRPEPAILQIDGAYSRMVEAEDYVVDPHAHCIVSRRDAAMVAVIGGSKAGAGPDPTAGAILDGAGIDLGDA
jgi:RecA/RadA recombinase